MLRRPFTEEPMSKLAAWSSRLAWFALAVSALSIVVVRSGALEVEPALATFGAGLFFAVLAVILAFAAFVSIWRQGRTGLGRAVLGMFLGLLVLGYPGYLAYRASTLPAIYDVTTDPADPPRFVALAPERAADMNIYHAAFARQQRAAYPNLAPLQYDAPAKFVFDSALTIVNKRRWRIADAQPPELGRRDARIEAVAHSLVMGFPDDVVIRITAAGAGTRVDVRSASRHPWPDFGENAARVQALLDDIDDAVSNTPEPRAVPEPKAAPAPKRQPAKR